MSNKIGFWSVFALVTGSQIGTGVFIFPANLAPYGAFSLFGWLISGCGAIALSFVFAILCSKFPRTGGPHVYMHEAFKGSNLANPAAFFVGWSYWVISWVSTTAVIVTAVGYLSPFFTAQHQSNLTYLIVEAALLFSITAINIRGINAAGRVEILLTILKFVPLLIVSIIALRYFDKDNFSITPQVSELSYSQIIGKVTLLTLWGFIGLETATTAAGSVLNAARTIPKAIVLGTLSVVIFYMINSISIMGLIPSNVLASSTAPYVDASQLLFGGQWHFMISFVACIVCIGTLNAWMITSGQIVLGLAEDRLMPAIFAKRNKNNAPVIGLITSALGILPLLIMTANQGISQQITLIIDFSVTAFLFVYLACSIALLKIIYCQQDKKLAFTQLLPTIVAILFCCWVIYETPIKIVAVASLFTISGVPVYWFWFRKTLVTITAK